MSNKIYFPLHIDSGNRGCEAICLGTIEILKLYSHGYVGLCRDIDTDKKISKNMELVKGFNIDKLSVWRKLLYKVCGKFFPSKLFLNYYYRKVYYNFLKNSGDISLITGGDMLCYGNNEVNYITDYLYSHNKKVVLWGCSVGKENLTPEKNVALKKFSCITTRESLTYDLLKNEMNLPNVYLFPDPAFVLNPEKCDLPVYFSKKLIGVNLSNFVGGNIDNDTIFGKNIINLFDYILENTQYEIVLIPHVFWKGQDDRIACNYFYENFKNNNRIHVLTTEKMTYCQIRYAISKCKFFIGARTHAMISAYSTCVPSIALGYSIKSKGIAKDLNMPDYTIIDYRNLENNDEIVKKFKKLQENEVYIRELLEEEMPNYIKTAYNAKECIDDLEGK